MHNLYSRSAACGKTWRDYVSDTSFDKIGLSSNTSVCTYFIFCSSHDGNGSCSSANFLMLFSEATGFIVEESGIICKLFLESKPKSSFHLRVSVSQNRMWLPFLKISAAILAMAEAQVLGIVLCTTLPRICNRQIPHEISIDSRSVSEAMIEHHELNDFAFLA